MNIKEIHRSNFDLINKHKLVIGSRLKLKDDVLGYLSGDIFMIECINPFYGWIKLKSDCFPQDVKSILKIFEVIK